MASKTVQMVFLVLGAIGVMGVITCCALPEWVVGLQEYDMKAHIGLWKACGKQRTGPQHCVKFDGSRMSSEYYTFRAMIVLSCMFGILSLLLLCYGSDFTTCVQNQDTKTKMILAAGVGLMLAGLLVIIPVSWFSHHFRNAEEAARLEAMLGEMLGVTLGAMLVAMLGSSIYIGFLSGLMLMLTGGLLCYFIRS